LPESTGPKDARPSIDWAQIHQRLANASAALAECWQPDEERQRRLLAERAERLVQVRAAIQEQAAEDLLSVLEFQVAQERYAVEVAWVKEVCAPKALTPVPCTPAFIAGVIHVRGRIVSVLNLHQFFGLPHQGLSNLNRVVIVQTSGLELGILADSILGERKLPPTALKMPAAEMSVTEPDWRAKYLQGLTREGMQVLALEKLLAAPELIINEEVL
jgi:purine-binding chemotaxis protein CheW